jgi:hypothetical protein
MGDDVSALFGAPGSEGTASLFGGEREDTQSAYPYQTRLIRFPKILYGASLLTFC